MDQADDQAVADDIRRAVGNAMRVALAEAGVSQTALGAGLGYVQGTVAAWLAGTNSISLVDLLRVDMALGRRRGKLLDDAGVIDPRSLLEAIDDDKALDEQGRDELRGAYEKAIAGTARRRIAEVARDGDTTETTPVVSLVPDPQVTSPAAVLLLQLFGRDGLRQLADELASAAS